MTEEFNERYLSATLRNGDKSTGVILNDGGRRWFVCLDKDGNGYETEEQPCIRIDLTNAEHWVIYAGKRAAN